LHETRHLVRGPSVDIPDSSGQDLTVPVAPEDVLDNAVWHALRTRHEPLAEGTGRARRYVPALSVFGGVDTLDTDGWAALAELVGPGGTTVLFRPALPAVPAGWRERARGTGNQFVAWSLADLDGDDAPPIVELGPADAEAMLALATLTRPGPFALRTPELGHFVGVFDDGELVAMAGERLQPEGYTEVSAVCTHPASRGRGLAALLTDHVATQIRARGDTPFLHVAEGNDGARRVYERLGFTLRTPVEFVAVTYEEQP
jgi:ribosomal protein S18 acetylase RimI-like enzyme